MQEGKRRLLCQRKASRMGTRRCRSSPAGSAFAALIMAIVPVVVVVMAALLPAAFLVVVHDRECQDHAIELLHAARVYRVLHDAPPLLVDGRVEENVPDLAVPVLGRLDAEPVVEDLILGLTQGRIIQEGLAAQVKACVGHAEHLRMQFAGGFSPLGGPA